MANEAEQAIYQRLASAPLFHPASVELLPEDWVIETGDVVSVKSGEETYSVPVYSHTLVWNGKSKSTIESTGNQEREPLPELRRKEYQQGHATYSGLKAQKQEIDEHWVHVTDVTDKGMSDAFGIIGVSIGADGYPVKDGSGNYVWDDSGTGGEIWGHLNRTAWSTQILNHIKDANGHVMSLAEVTTDAYGNVIINAINDSRTGTATINANRVLISGNTTLNGALEINNNGYLWVKKNALFGGDVSSNSTVEISGGTVSAYTQEVKSGGVLRINGASGYSADINFLKAGSLITDLQFVEDQSANGSYYLQKKTVYNQNWANATNFNMASTVFFQNSVGAAKNVYRDRDLLISLSTSDMGQTVDKPVVIYNNYDSSYKTLSIPISVPSGGGGNITIMASVRESANPGGYTEIFEDAGAYTDLRNKVEGFYTFKVTSGSTEKWYGFWVGPRH